MFFNLKAMSKVIIINSFTDTNILMMLRLGHELFQILGFRVRPLRGRLDSFFNSRICICISSSNRRSKTETYWDMTELFKENLGK